MAKMGRPQKEYDTADFEGLISIGADEEEVVAFLRHKHGSCSSNGLTSWLRRTYGAEYGENVTFRELKEKMGLPLQKLKVRKGVNTMIGKNAAVTIFAAKNILGWTDKVEQTNITEGALPNINIRFIDNKEGAEIGS
jgi:hypothetical protein